MRMPTLPIAMVLLVASASASLAACPQNHFSIGPTGELSSLAVDSRNSATSAASYNVPAGTLRLSFACSGSGGECGSGGGVYVEDDFSVVGLPNGTLVSLMAHLRGTLSGGGYPPIYAIVSAVVKDANGNSQTATVPPTTSYDLALPVPAIVGQTFRLHFELNGNSLGPVPGSGDATFSFSGVPAGAAVTSCQGYASDTAVAAHPMTWARVKSIYR